MVAHQLRHEFVARAREPARLRDVAEPQAGIGDRHRRGCDAAGVHVFDRLRGAPLAGRRLQEVASDGFVEP